MARVIQPKGLRRLRAGGPVEVKGASAYWVKWDLLSTSSHQAVVRKWGDPTLWSQEAFLIDENTSPPEAATHEMPKSDERVSEERVSEETEPDEAQASSSDDDSDSESPSESDDDAPKGPMEDIVEKLASNLDRKLAKQMAEQFVTHPQMADAFTAFAETFKPAPSVSAETPNAHLETLIAKVEIRKHDELVLEKEGLFHNQFPKLVRDVLAGQHVYLPGPPGTGKSHAAEQVADMIGWHFGSISLGPQTPDSRLWGGMDAHGNFHDTMLTRLMIWAEENPESGSVFCLDELDNGNSGNIATLNSAMANGWTTLPNGRTVRFGGNMVFIGCANTYGTGPTSEFAGRNKLDAATLDRFVYLPWDTDQGVETALVRRYLHGDLTEEAVAWLDVWRTARVSVEKHGLKIFVTMRGCVNGAKMIARGESIEEAFMQVLGNKLPKDQFDKINPL